MTKEQIIQEQEMIKDRNRNPDVFHRGSFELGWDKSREVLLKESDEFDIHKAETQSNATQGGYLNEKGRAFVCGAFWQYKQDQLKIQGLKKAIKKADELLEKSRILLSDKADLLRDRDQHIQELEEKLAKYEAKYLGRP